MQRAMKRRLAIGLITLGSTLVISGVLGTVLPGDHEAVAAPTSSPTSAAVATTGESAVTSEAPPATTAPESTTASSTTTTTTEPSEPDETVEEFADAFARALQNGDSGFVFRRLHPVVLERHDEQLCRDYVEREVMQIEDYRLTGPPTGPTPATFNAPNGEVSVDELWRAPVSFTFQGQPVDTEGAFAVVDGQMHWFTDCR